MHFFSLLRFLRLKQHLLKKHACQNTFRKPATILLTQHNDAATKEKMLLIKSDPEELPAFQIVKFISHT